VSADQRLTAAREYLGYARQVKVADLPHSALMRLAAELRRQLGQALDAVTENAPLTDAQREVLRQALHDAIAWHEDPEPCRSCEYQAPALCAEHAEAVAQRDAYIRLARELGIEVAR